MIAGKVEHPPLPNGYNQGMELNSCEAPRNSLNCGNQRIFRAGLKLTAFAFVLPFLAWIVAYGLVALVFVVSSEPVPQGAIAVAFFAFRASLPVAATILVAGICLAWINRRS